MTRRDQYMEQGDPIKIGCLFDNPAVNTDYAERIYDLVVEQYKASGRFERGFEFVKVYPYGPPAGNFQNVLQGYHDLCDQGCIAVIGCNHADDTIAIPSYADARKVPLMALGATTQGMSKFTFSISWSSIPHDAYTMASWLKKQGHKRIAVSWDRADHGHEYMLHFRNACARAGLQILTDIRFPHIILPELPQIFDDAVSQFKALQPDALAHFGTGWVASHWAKFVNESGWNVPRIMNDAFCGASMPDYVDWYEGWVGVTMWDDDNKVTAKFYDDYCARYPDGVPPGRELLGHYRDAMTALIEGIILAPIMTPDGVRRGLEMVQMLPAASGGPRTCISFNPHNHRGLGGPDVMVLRRVKEGQLIMEGHIELF